MAKKMLIDATHAEEVRVAVVDGNRLEEFDSETSTKRQIKGNIYLAKVIRIEPSLQAAFVEFGGNRHGFLPFGEIHPDYFRIPVSDRTRLAASQKEVIPLQEVSLSETGIPDLDASGGQDETAAASVEEGAADVPSGTDVSLGADMPADPALDLIDEDEIPRRPRNYHYKIQEVIKRRQIMLVQVVKEERGNKGPALTTYLSLPGRYCVLIPNAGHRGGGISRKISEGSDRRRLRDILKELEIPEGMSLIVRTAGQERNKLEIRRDFDYLIRLWEEIRSKTLEARAPELIYAEGDLIKRSIRDIYNRDIDQILVDGEEAYKAAKNLMKALIPSHTKKVQPYRDAVPLFHRYNVEGQIDVMMDPVAKLPSGGSIVINPTEALVAIDVNSGRSTRERHIDETALKTNLEAADEVARQMRLRDLAGLVVIDFIDMNDQKHIQAVEKRLKEATRHDRARTQIGHIDHFGILVLSRQRLRPSLIETNSSPCSHCRGTGLVRSVESASLLALRAIENTGIEGKSAQLVMAVPPGIDLYLLNQKRASLINIETRYEMQVTIVRDETLISPEYRLECLKERETPFIPLPLVPIPVAEIIEDDEIPEPDQTDVREPEGMVIHLSSSPVSSSPAGEDKNEGGTGGGRRRRRRRSSARKASTGQSEFKGSTTPAQQDNPAIAAGTGDVNPPAQDVPPAESDRKENIPPENNLSQNNFKKKSHKRIEESPNGNIAPAPEAPAEGEGEGEDNRGNLKEDSKAENSRRRRRGRRLHSRSDSRPAHQNIKVDETSLPLKASPFQPPSVSVAKAEEFKMPYPQLLKQDLPRMKNTEIVVPITSLPIGAENAGVKNSRGRWWKRLLES